MTTRPEDSMPYWIGWFGQTIVTAIARGEQITVEQARTVHTGLCAAAGLPDDYLDKFTTKVHAATPRDVTPEPERTVVTAEMLAEHAKWRKGEGGKRIMLAGAYLAGAYLAGANLAGANLAGANLAGANLAGANLAGANLGGAYLADAYLADAYLAGANLSGANLSGANLSGANLAGADLGGAYLAGAKGNRWTTLPTGWKVDDSGLIVKVES